MTDSAPSTTDIATELSAWVAGGGILTMMLFPLALPLLALLAITAAPLVLVALVGGLAAAVVALPLLLVRSVGRRAIRAMRPVTAAERDASPAHQQG